MSSDNPRNLSSSRGLAMSALSRAVGAMSSGPADPPPPATPAPHTSLDAATPSSAITITFLPEFSSYAGDGTISVRNLITIKAGSSSVELPLDLVIVMDRSGSMRAPDRLTYALETAHIVADDLKPTDRLAIVSFDDKVETVLPLSLVTPSVLATAHAGIAAVTARGGTYLYDAVVAGLALLPPNRSTDRSALLLVVSDGESEATRCSERDVVAAAKAIGVPIHTIGLGAAHDAAKMGTLARATGGIYRAIADKEELSYAATVVISKAQKGVVRSATVTIAAMGEAKANDTTATTSAGAAAVGGVGVTPDTTVQDFSVQVIHASTLVTGILAHAGVETSVSQSSCSLKLEHLAEGDVAEFVVITSVAPPPEGMAPPPFSALTIGVATAEVTYVEMGSGTIRSTAPVMLTATRHNGGHSHARIPAVVDAVQRIAVGVAEAAATLLEEEGARGAFMRGGGAGRAKRRRVYPASSAVATAATDPTAPIASLSAASCTANPTADEANEASVAAATATAAAPLSEPPSKPTTPASIIAAAQIVLAVDRPDMTPAVFAGLEARLKRFAEGLRAGERAERMTAQSASAMSSMAPMSAHAQAKADVYTSSKVSGTYRKM